MQDNVVPEPSSALDPDVRRWSATYLVILCGCVLATWFAVTGFFFAEDDFGLIFQARQEGIDTVTNYFRRSSIHFRPLSKGAYFLIMDRVFGLDAFPYHAVSLALHTLNTVLVYLVLRRLRCKVPGALVGATLFGLGMTSFTILAWISCIQMILGTTFALVATLTCFDALTSVRWRSAAASWISYALALACLEQPLGLPLILVVIAFFHARPMGFRHVARVLAPHLILMTLFIGSSLFWRSIPNDGVYAFTVGPNMLANLSLYTGWATGFLADHTITRQSPHMVFFASHVLLGIAIAWLVARRRLDALCIGGAYFGVLIGPALGLVGHAYRHHVYTAWLGVLLLFAAAVDEFLAWRRFGSTGTRRALAAFLVLMTIGSVVMVRHNIHALGARPPHLPRHFVIRHAMLARNAYDDIRAQLDPQEPIDVIHMIHLGSEGREPQRIMAINVKKALGNGAGLRLLFDRLDLPFEFWIGEQAEDLEGTVFTFDEFGHCTLRPPPTD